MQLAEDTTWIFMEPLNAPAGDDELAELARALREEVSSALARLPQLKVAFEDQHSPQLNARYLLKGARSRALAASRRAVDLDRNNAYAHFQLAELQYFRKDLGAFRATAERAGSGPEGRRLRPGRRRSSPGPRPAGRSRRRC
jgi:hypothetical protein